MDTSDLAPFAKFIRQGKITGWWFLVGGSVCCLSAIPPVFNPPAPILVNGIPTNDFTTKLGVATFVASFPVVGALLAFTPKHAMQKGLIAIIRFTKRAFKPR